MEEMADDPSEQYAEREEFEKQYYSLVAAARQLISNARKQASGNSIAEVQNANVNNLQRFRRIECLKQHFWSRFSHFVSPTTKQMAPIVRGTYRRNPCRH
nr:uncharacterized protein LOC126055385 [Helicoverpa armigera]